MPVTETTEQLPVPIEPEKPESPRLWPIWLVAVIALVIAVVLAVWSWQQWNNHQATRQVISDLRQDTARLEDLYGNRGSEQTQDRKSTRLNSSHVRISYAVFCLK